MDRAMWSARAYRIVFCYEKARVDTGWLAGIATGLLHACSQRTRQWGSLRSRSTASLHY
jgi:hypothetical protein